MRLLNPARDMPKADAAVLAVVDYLAWPEAVAGFQVIDAQPVASPPDVLRAYAKAAEAIDGCLAYLVTWNLAHEVCLMAEIGEAYGHVGFTSAIVHVECVTLYESLVSW